MTRLAPTSIKDVLQSTAPIAAVHVQGWVRTRRDSKDFSFIELNDGSSLRNLQIIAKNSLPNYPAVQRITAGGSVCATRAAGAFPGEGGKSGNWFGTQWGSLVPPMIPIRSRKRGTHLNFFARSLIYAHVQTFSAAFFACGAGWPLPFTSFSRSAVSCTSTRQLSLAAIARVQENCFASPLSISKIRRGKTGKLILRRISSPARLI